MKKLKLFMCKSLFYLILSLTMLMFFMNNVIIEWMIMEFATMVSVAFINFNKNKMPSVIYYLMSSLVSIFMVLMLMMTYCQILNMNDNSMYFGIIFQIMMMFKLGMFPFSYWMIYVYNNIEWEDLFILSTFMKYIPLMFLSNFVKMNQSMLIMLMVNSIMIAIIAYKFYTVKSIVACSSINQTSFLFLLMYFNKSIFLVYIILYTMIFYFLCFVFSKMNIHKKLDLLHFIYGDNKSMITLIFLIHSMLPPFTSFILKWLFVFELMNMFNYSMWFLIIMLLSSVIMIWNYFKLFEYPLVQFLMNYNLNLKQVKVIDIMLYFYIGFNMTMIVLFYLY